MRRDVLELRAFYASARGRAAREMVARKLSEAWGDPRGLEFLGLGYATPYLEAVRERARRTIAVMPASQGVEVWPAVGRNLACLAPETALPLPNAMFDRVVCVHALEEAEDAVAMMQEVCRVLSPTGRVFVAVAARNGLWSNAEGTPFGHGRPWSRSQLEAVLRAADLEPSGWTRALYAPPFAWTARWAEGFELVMDGGDRHIFGRVEIHDAEGRHMAHRPVDLVEVDHVGLHSLEAGVAGFGDVRWGQVVAAAPHPAHAACRAGHFGGQHQLVARARIFFKPVAQDFFGDVEGLSSRGHRVHLCCVQKVDTARQRVVQDGVRRGLVDLFAKSHGAQADWGHLEIAGAEFDFFHGVGWVVYGTVAVSTTAA